jgi:hypothetical protein
MMDDDEYGAVGENLTRAIAKKPATNCLSYGTAAQHPYFKNNSLPSAWKPVSSIMTTATSNIH